MEKEIKEVLVQQYHQTQFAIAFVKGGEVNYSGFIKEEDTLNSIKNDDFLFEIGSITKVFTANILAQLVCEGKLDLEEPVSNYLAFESLRKAKISFLQLANHSSGLPRLPSNFYTIKNHDERNPYRHYTAKDLEDYLSTDLSLETTPGEKFSYSNLGFGILSYAFSIVEQKSFTQIVQERIFDPLEMTTSSFQITEQREKMLMGINQFGEKANHWDGGILNGAIGIASSARDMAKFMSALMDTTNPVSNLQSRKSIDIQTNYSIALGLGVRTLANGNVSYNHGGGSDGFTSFMKLDSVHQRGILLLTNVSAFHKSHQALEDLSCKLRDAWIAQKV